MYCTNCGRKAEGTFCSFCGAGIGQAPSAHAPHAPTARGKTPLLICMIALLVVAVGLGGYFLVQGMPGDSGGSADSGSAVGGSPSGVSLGSASVGSVIEFSGYDWRVLEVRDGQVLLLSEHILERRQYYHTFEEITWEGSDIRSYLNGEFYNSFSSSERARIQETRISNDDDDVNGITGGNDTTDKVFLLSKEELENYFGDTLLAEGSVWNTDWVTTELSGDPFWWWLRTTCDIPEPGLAVVITSDGGQLRCNVQGAYGIRPALWLNLYPGFSDSERRSDFISPP